MSHWWARKGENDAGIASGEESSGTSKRRKDIVGADSPASHAEGDSDMPRVTLTAEEVEDLRRAARSQLPTFSNEFDAPAVVGSEPPITGKPDDSGGHFFEHLDDKLTGVAERMILCLDVLQRVTQAMNVREFDKGKAFKKTAFLMPFPVASEDRIARMRVYAFDHNEPYADLYVINHHLFNLINFKDTNTMGTLVRDERINLIQAMTVYFGDLVAINPERLTRELKHLIETLNKLASDVNFKQAVESLNRMNWQIVNMAGVPERSLIFNAGRGKEEIVIDQAEVRDFKLTVMKYFLEKAKLVAALRLDEPMNESGNNAAAKAGVIDAGPERLSRDMKGAATDVLGREAILTGDTLEHKRQANNLEAARKARRLKEISLGLLKVLNPTGGFLNDKMTVLTLVGDLLMNEDLDFEECRVLYGVDMEQARVLKVKMDDARQEIAGLNLAKNQVYTVMSQFLSGEVHAVSPEILRALVGTA